MTEAEFVAWVDEDTRAEWVDGEVILMAPVSGEHSRLATWLLSVTSICAEERGLGAIYGTEFMVRFSKLRSRRIPDVLFVSKSRAKLVRPHHFEGAPDLIMEVVSPDSESRDWREKFEEYRKAGVREYWIIDPASEQVEVYKLNRRKKYVRIEEQAGRIVSMAMPGFWIKAEWLWSSKRPTVLEAAHELGLI